MRYKLTNVLLENNPRSVSFPALYCRATAPVFKDEAKGEWVLYGPGEFDFTTFFNAISSQKWRRYTVAQEFFLHLELKGAACEVYSTHADAMTRTASPERSAQPFVKMPAGDEWAEVDVQLPVLDTDIVCGFVIVAEGPVSIRSSYYATEVEPSQVREVELALATTTFKKEDYIINNIGLLRNEILACDDPISEHFWVHVVDNGSTLDAEALSGGRVQVHPSGNVGGSGGFARGMILALEQEVPATHVLLMDDDVAVSPESIKRTYTLLTLLNDEYKEAFISGSMMDYEIGEDQWEDLGYMTKEGRFAPVKPMLRMTLLRDVVFNEAFVPGPEYTDRMYAAWWYCCIPTDVIRREGLPLPVFVRCDDAEYGIRCKPKFITMNGICIWHLSFHSRYNAAVERYQTTRNTLIGQATTNMVPDSDFLGELKGNMQIELKKFNYTNAELLLDGLEDFMKGPDFISERVAEECFLRSNKKAEKLVSFEELQKQLDEAGIDINLAELSVHDVDSDFKRSPQAALYDFITYNGQRTPFVGNIGGVAVIPAAGWMYPAGKMHKHDTFVAIDPYNRKGVIRHLDKERFQEVNERYKRDLKQFGKIKDQLYADYAAAREKLTSMEFWKDYLEMTD